MAQVPSSPGKKSFHRHVERAIKHNETASEDKRKSLHVHYKKLNGRTVKRRISPLKMNGHTIIAYDHKRKALRSFRMERVKHMEKAAFWVGFEKAAASPHPSTLPREELERRADSPRKRPLGRLALGVLGGAALEPSIHGATGMGSVLGLVGAASALRHNRRREEARDHLLKEKQGSAFAHGAELAGLGILAAPAVQHLRGKEMSEGAKAKSEVAGLGVLAAPSAVAAAKGAWRAGKGLFHKG